MIVDLNETYLMKLKVVWIVPVYSHTEFMFINELLNSTSSIC